MTKDEWLAVEGTFAALVHDARSGLCDAAKTEVQHPVMAAVYLLLAAARGLPHIAQHTGQDHLVPSLHALRLAVGEVVLAALFPEGDEVPDAFRKAFSAEPEEGGHD